MLDTEIFVSSEKIDAIYDWIVVIAARMCAISTVIDIEHVTTNKIRPRISAAYFVIPSNSIKRLSLVMTIPSSHSSRHESAGLSLCSFCPLR